MIVHASNTDDYQKFVTRLDWYREVGSIVFTNGCFDILHQGHLDVLDHCQELIWDERDNPIGVLIIGLNSDHSVQKLKGLDRPIFHEDFRANMLDRVTNTVEIVIFDEASPERILRDIRPDVIVKGGDYAPESVVGSEYAKKVEIVPLRLGYSTTSVIEKIKR